MGHADQFKGRGTNKNAVPGQTHLRQLWTYVVFSSSYGDPVPAGGIEGMPYESDGSQQFRHAREGLGFKGGEIMSHESYKLKPQQFGRAGVQLGFRGKKECLINPTGPNNSDMLE